ncbi:MAG: type 4a pilus biogenesis protein PilO [Patescibacteria group bacterium]|nr:type 4a pilus biogenesis protein PilO [Patescibacteria group bacterium]MDE2116362.1 type 4a pilus biogenesis protein PilO [Patescibacteria group bacterium]
MSNTASIILILASIGLFFGYIDPTYNAIQQANVQKAAYERALSNSKQLGEERDTLLAKYNQMDPNELADLSKLLPDNIDNIRLILDVDSMARTYGMRIRDFTTTTDTKQDTIGAPVQPYGTLTLSFTTTATYNTFLEFLHDLERSLRIIDVSSVQFSTTDTSQLYDFKVTVETYWLK